MKERPRELSKPARRGPGRPRLFATDEILDAALELFWRQGFRATTTRDLETDLQLSQSSLYNAFGSKRDLLNAALDRYEAHTDAELLRPLVQSKEGLRALDDFVVALGRWVTHHGHRGCMLTNMMAEDGGVNDAITKRTSAYRGRVRRALLDRLETAAESGEIESGALDERADLLLGAILGFSIAARGGATHDELNRLLDAMRALVSSWHRSTPASSSSA